jgi:hypothetical protein
MRASLRAGGDAGCWITARLGSVNALKVQPPLILMNAALAANRAAPAPRLVTQTCDGADEIPAACFLQPAREDRVG